MDWQRAAEFLDDAARYFRNRDTGGEDMAHWSNVYNGDNCEKIARMIREQILPAPPRAEE